MLCACVWVEGIREIVMVNRHNTYGKSSRRRGGGWVEATTTTQCNMSFGIVQFPARRVSRED